MTCGGLFKIFDLNPKLFILKKNECCYQDSNTKPMLYSFVHKPIELFTSIYIKILKFY